MASSRFAQAIVVVAYVRTHSLRFTQFFILFRFFVVVNSSRADLECPRALCVLLFLFSLQRNTDTISSMCCARRRWSSSPIRRRSKTITCKTISIRHSTCTSWLPPLSPLPQTIEPDTNGTRAPCVAYSYRILFSRIYCSNELATEHNEPLAHDEIYTELAFSRQEENRTEFTSLFFSPACVRALGMIVIWRLNAIHPKHRVSPRSAGMFDSFIWFTQIVN